MSEGAKGLRLVSSHLVSISARRSVEVPREVAEIQLARKSSIIVLERDGEDVRARFSMKVFFRPFGPFELDLEIDGRFRSLGDMPRDIEKALENAAQPLYANASHIAAFISDRIIGVPFIVPPFKEKGEVEATLAKNR